MYGKTLIATALLTIATIGIAGPSAAYESPCEPGTVLDATTLTCVDLSEVIADNRPRPNIDGWLEGLATGTVGSWEPSAEGVLIELAPDLLDVITDTDVVDLVIDPVVTLPSGGAVEDVATIEVSESDEVTPDAPTTDDTAPIEDVAVDAAPLVGVAESETATTSETVTSEPGPVPASDAAVEPAAQGSDELAEPLAAAPVASTTDPLVAGLLGAGIVALLMLGLIGAYAMGRRS